MYTIIYTKVYTGLMPHCTCGIRLRDQYSDLGKCSKCIKIEKRNAGKIPCTKCSGTIAPIQHKYLTVTNQLDAINTIECLTCKSAGDRNEYNRLTVQLTRCIKALNN